MLKFEEETYYDSVIALERPASDRVSQWDWLGNLVHARDWKGKGDSINWWELISTSTSLVDCTHRRIIFAISWQEGMGYCLHKWVRCALSLLPPSQNHVFEHGSSCCEWIRDNLFTKRLKVRSRSNMLILTYEGPTPKYLPLLVQILCPLKKVSQSSIPSSHFSHAKAAQRVRYKEASTKNGMKLDCKNSNLPGRGSKTRLQ